MTKVPMAVSSMLALMFACWTSLALASDRAPTPEERAMIEQVLRTEGFSSWEEIELDDGFWEVDDARGADGREYDLKLDPATLRIVERDPD